MAFASTHSHVALPGLSGFATALESLVERVSRYRLYRRTMAELANASPRDLAELGLSRSNLRSAAFQAVYGTGD